MFAGLMYFLFWNLKKKQVSAFARFFLTPQVWYLYTYCTSDALDFAVGVLVLYQIANPDSMLHGLARDGIHKCGVWKLLLLGFLFSNIFMSKQNYYVLAIYAVCMLLGGSFRGSKGRKETAVLLCICVLREQLFCFWGIRYIPEFVHYGIQRGGVLREMQEAIAIPKLNPASPPAEQSSAFNLHGKGVPLADILFHMGLNKTLLRSFVGTYGSPAVPSSPDWYMWLMGLLYLVFLSVVCWQVLREKGHRERKVKLGFFIYLRHDFLCAGDLQRLVYRFPGPRGRYMLPVLIFAAHAAALKPEIPRQRWFQILICATALLSLYSFGLYCVPNIQAALLKNTTAYPGPKRSCLLRRAGPYKAFRRKM